MPTPPATVSAPVVVDVDWVKLVIATALLGAHALNCVVLSGNTIVPVVPLKPKVQVDVLLLFTETICIVLVLAELAMVLGTVNVPELALNTAVQVPAVIVAVDTTYPPRNILVAVSIPPTFKLPCIPTPPVTVNAPDVVVRLAVALVMLIALLVVAPLVVTVCKVLVLNTVTAPELVVTAVSVPAKMLLTPAVTKLLTVAVVNNCAPATKLVVLM
jgi:hypothetical protein